jgi:hypothetical protein
VGPLHWARALALGTRRTELPRSALRTAAAEFRTETARIEPFTGRSLPGVHARSHCHWTLGRAVATKFTLLPRRTLAAPTEVRPRKLGKTILPLAHARPVTMSAMLRLRALAWRRPLRAFTPHVAITPMLAWTIVTPLAIALPFGTRSFLHGPTRTIAVTARFAFGARLAISIGTNLAPAGTFVPSFATGRSFAPAFRLSPRLARSAAFTVTSLRPASFAAAWRALGITRRAHFVRHDATVAVAVELAKNFGGVSELFIVDRAVVIRIERTEEARHRTLTAALGRAFTARAAFALGWLGRTLRWIWLLILREERTRREGECHRGEDGSICFHEFLSGCGIGGCHRGMRRAFIGQNATRSRFCLS